ncbi:hypothetical protein V2J09_005951, partial [Rumex salicifolius]
YRFSLYGLHRIGTKAGEEEEGKVEREREIKQHQPTRRKQSGVAVAKGIKVALFCFFSDAERFCFGELRVCKSTLLTGTFDLIGLCVLGFKIKLKMAADSNTGFNREEVLGSAMNRHGISFQSGAVSSSSEMIGMGSYYVANNSTGSLVFSGNSGMIGNNSSTAVTQAGNSSSPPLINSVSGLKDDTSGLAVEWSAEEQYKLEEGLIKFADEPSILRYIKIASAFREKTVRDVALRCRWMTRKRRKQEEPQLGRKGGNRKEKMAESSAKANIFSASTSHMAAHSFSMHQMNQNARIKLEVMSTTARQLLEQNIQAFSEINQNLSSLRASFTHPLFCK